MAFSNEFKERVKKATNLLELISDYTDLRKIEEHLWSGRCPHPDHNDSNPSFRVFENSPGDFTWKCFGCQDIYAKKGTGNNYGSDCFAFIQWISDCNGGEKISFTDSVRILAERAGIPIEYTRDVNHKVFLHNEQRAWLAHQNLLPQVIRYLYGRGLDDSDIELWNIGVQQRYEQRQLVLRIVFPLVNRNNQCLGFSCRLFENDEKRFPKYWNSPSSDVFQKGKFLFGQQFLSSTYKDIRITEGQFDVILAYKYGVKNIVGTLGTAFTKEHAVLCRYWGFKPVFIFDGDDAGDKGIVRAVKHCVNLNIPSRVCVLPRGVDLADLSARLREKTEQWIQDHTVPAWQYQMADISTVYDSGISDLRTKILPNVRKILEYPMTPEDKILFRSLVKERFDIIL